MDSEPSPSHDETLSIAARLTVGAQLGPFKIERLIGAGGMGEVYLAVDTRLNRKVAIKVSAEQFSGRFEREARAIAALNHPNICTLHDVGPNYLVMEFVEGETLADRLKRGALPRELVLRFGTAIAQALAAAHAKGIVHRDLKPGNIMLAKSGIKVLDFGLAKSGHDETVTASNAIVGTPAYMAPEQAEGRESDARTDIYALGLVLYEMAAGKRLPRDEPLSAEVVPPLLAQTIRSCVAKDPDQRWQSAADVALALNWTVDEPPAKRPGSRVWAWWAAAIAVLALVLIPIATRFRQTPAEAQSLQLQLNAPPGADFGVTTTAISPDGQTLAFVAGSARRLWVRPFDSLSVRELTGTDGALLPFWSPDGRSLGFFADSKLKRIDLAGERVVTLADAPAGRGGTWNADDIILYSAATNGPIWKVSALGGTPAPATALDSSREASHRLPQFLPDGRRFLFYIRSGEIDVRGIYLASVEDPRQRVRVVETFFNGWYAPPRGPFPGHLLWMREGGGLIAQPFDAAAGRLSGAPALVPEIELQAGGGADRLTPISVSSDGKLIFGRNDSRFQLAWYTREGETAETLGIPERYSPAALRVSPDGKRFAVGRIETAGREDIWAGDSISGGLSRVTVDGGGSGGGLAWSPDGERIAHLSGGVATAARATIFASSSTGAGSPERLTNTPHSQANPDWSPDGKFVLYTETSSEANFDLWVVPMTGDRKPIPYLQTPFQESQGRFSPNGKWISYTSNESGRQEVFVKSFPATAAKQRVSAAGGSSAVWRRDGKELFYLSAERNLMAVPVELVNGNLKFGAPATLFPIAGQAYDVSPDGRRFLVFVPIRGQEPQALTVVLNWQNKLKQRP